MGWAVLYVVLGVVILAIGGLLFALWQVQKYLNAWNASEDSWQQRAHGDHITLPDGFSLRSGRAAAVTDRGGSAPVSLLHSTDLAERAQHDPA